MVTDLGTVDGLVVVCVCVCVLLLEEMDSRMSLHTELSSLRVLLFGVGL